MSIGKRIKSFAETAYNDVAEFAQAFGWKPSGLYKYFSDDRDPGAPMLAKLYELGCDINWLLSGNGEMFANNEAGRLLKEKQNPESKVAGSISTETDKEKNIRESIEAARVEPIGTFPEQAGEAILKYDRLKAAATPQAPKGKKKAKK